jgi:hypothetical protein
MSLKQVRDSKDPGPNAKHSFRVGGDGNTPVNAGEHQEDHDAKKAERIGEKARFTLRTGGESQPTRCSGDGNVPVNEAQGEKHNQSKAERVPASRRF